MCDPSECDIALKRMGIAGTSEGRGTAPTAVGRAPAEERNMTLDWLLGADRDAPRRRSTLWVLGLALAVSMGCGDDGATGDDDDDDVPVDAGPRVDGGPDFRFICTIGDACEEAGDCPGANPSIICRTPESEEVGLPVDPVVGLDEPFTTTEWVGGYCSNLGTEAQGGCTEDEDCGTTRMGEPNCGRCLTVDFDPSSGNPIRSCFKRCVPSNVDNGGCRAGYRCDFGLQVCVPGCSADEECRVYREDTNGNGEIDRYNPILNRDGDRLVFEEGTDAFCSPDTWFCKQSGNPDATAGDPCDRNGVCMQDGECLTEIATDGEFPGGYCTRLGCDVPGRGCDDTDEVCQSRGFGDTPACLRRCTVGAEADLPQKLGETGSGSGCRETYACKWNGRLSPSNDVGGCLPGNYNGIAEPNLGANCGAAVGDYRAVDASCYSPFGVGECSGRVLRLDSNTDPDQVGRTWWTTCSIADCRADGIDDECSTAGGVCVEFAGGEPSNSRCLQPCETQADCASPALACNTGLTGDGQGVCWWSCRDRRGRRQDEYCQTGWECTRSSVCFPEE